MPKTTHEAPKTRRCEFEPGSFPQAEFDLDPGWGWVHHHAGTPLHNTDGSIVESRKQGVPAQKMAGGWGSLAQKLRPAIKRWRKQPLPPLAPRE